MNVFAKILTLAGMLATVAWFFWNPEGWVFQWEPIVVFLLSLSGYVAAEKTDTSTRRKEQTTHVNDVQLFRKFLEVLPSQPFIEFLKEHDFLVDFKLEALDPLYRFIGEWDNAEHEFIDTELERHRDSLLVAGKELRNKIGKYTSPSKNGWQAVRSDRLRHVEEHEERFRREADEINTAANDFVEIHQKLVREGRKKCNV